MKKPNPTPQTSGGDMSLTGHLKELRNRVAVCVVVLAVGIGVMLACAPRLVKLLTDMGTAYHYQFVTLAPQELLLVYFSVALLGGAIVTLPVAAYQAYAFCSPGLNKKERLLFLSAMISGVVFFCVGVLFAYFISMPFMLRFLIQFSEEMQINAAISIEKYITFLLTVFTVFGAVFELPVVSVLLTLLGIIKPEWMVKGRKVMVVVIFVVAAIITPPDIVSQVMVAVPMIGLYELSILLSKLCYKFKKEPVTEETAL